MSSRGIRTTKAVETSFFESDEEDNSPYDSDDPERFGPYYWTDSERKDTAGASVYLLDNAKWTAFKIWRGMDFAGLVLLDFFGLNKSRYQWVVDAAEREEREKEQRELEERQRKELKLAETEAEASKEASALEGGR